MPTLDTLTVRFEADARNLLNDLSALETRLDRLQMGRAVAFPSASELEMRLTVTADQAISHALSGAGDVLAHAVQAHEVQFSAALSQAQAALADTLSAAVDKLASSIRITAPVYIDGQKLADATVKNIRQQSITRGSYVALG
ncbi:MAG: hypothetical protein IKM26_05415 [Clostridia bacterium]|nr:hypothetical protein [Clostridia bacterium]